MTKGRRALVTGGAGFIGSHLVDRLVRDGWAVRVLDDFSSGRLENLAASHDRIELVPGDLCDGETLEKAVHGVEAVFHQAAIPSVPESIEDPVRTHEVNALGTLRLLQVARSAGVGRVVFAASCAIYGDGAELPKREATPVRALSPYALQKHIGERYCGLFADLYGLETVALRYFNVFGPRQDPASDYAAVIPRFARACLADEPAVIYGDGSQTRDFVYVDDVVEANLQAVASTHAIGRVVNVAGGRQTSLNQLLDALRELTGARAAPIHEAARPGDVRHSVADLTCAREWLGYEPKVSLREGLRRTVAALRADQQGVRA